MNTASLADMMSASGIQIQRPVSMSPVLAFCSSISSCSTWLPCPTSSVHICGRRDGTVPVCHQVRQGNCVVGQRTLVVRNSRLVEQYEKLGKALVQLRLLLVHVRAPQHSAPAFLSGDFEGTVRPHTLSQCRILGYAAIKVSASIRQRSRRACARGMEQEHWEPSWT